MSVPQITPFSVIPQRSDSPSTFVANADTFLSELVTWTTQANNMTVVVNGYVVSASNSATNASNSATNASNSATNASSYAAVSGATANYKGYWSSLSGVLNIPASVHHEGVVWALNSSLANVAASEPGVTNDWTPTSTSDLVLATSSMYAYFNLG